MMELSDTDLVDFRLRCLTAAERGYSIAHAHEYMETLEAEVGGMIAPPDEAEVASAAHLAELAGAVLEVRGGGGKKKGKKALPSMEMKAPEPPKTMKIVEPPKAPEPKVVEPVKVEEPKVETLKVEAVVEAPKEPAKVEEPAAPEAPKVEAVDPPKEEEVPPYETWTKDALVEEAHARKLQTTSRMTKAEVIELLETDDAKDAGK